MHLDVLTVKKHFDSDRICLCMQKIEKQTPLNVFYKTDKWPESQVKHFKRAS